MILFEHLNAPVVKPISMESATISGSKSSIQKSHIEKLALLTGEMKLLYQSICDYIESLGDDIVSNQLKYYIAYKKVRNIVCIEVYSKQIILLLKLSPDIVKLEKGFSRDMRGIGHYGTGDLQVTIKNAADFEKAKSLIDRAYNEA